MMNCSKKEKTDTNDSFPGVKHHHWLLQQIVSLLLLPDINTICGHTFYFRRTVESKWVITGATGFSSKGSNHKIKHLQSTAVFPDWFCLNFRSFLKGFIYFFIGSFLLWYHAEMPSEYLENQSKWVKTLCLSVVEPHMQALLTLPTSSLGYRNYPEPFTNTNITTHT